MFDWSSLIAPAIAGAFSFAGAWLAVRAELRAIRRDLERHEGELGTLHARINRLVERYRSN